jgi:UDP-N-acetylglucosamine transferase subunit ALG13
MILVTVGTEKFQFDRLMVWISILVKQNWLTKKIVVQYGNCMYFPDGIEAHKLLPAAEFQELARSADLVIGHCGEGTLLLAEKIEAPYILVPRMADLNEHVDNHQLELANQLVDLGVPIAFSLEELLEFVRNPIRVNFSVLSTSAINQICDSLELFSIPLSLTDRRLTVLNQSSISNEMTSNEFKSHGNQFSTQTNSSLG